ncbi:hypothetical protein [Parasphingorhabdus marina]|uniref:hypothetical protein n=1 Tax=Parasphingorhabdus marina TaxID=394732 RepID=UPI0013564821|nr:hypothetical protein [Parasphingorhabdus marina]
MKPENFIFNEFFGEAKVCFRDQSGFVQTRDTLCSNNFWGFVGDVTSAPALDLVVVKVRQLPCIPAKDVVAIPKKANGCGNQSMSIWQLICGHDKRHESGKKGTDH